MKTHNKILLAMSAALLLLLCASGVQAQSFINETFTGATAPDWTFINAAGDGPRLTAAAPVIDQPGSGWLRLTPDKTNQNSFVYYNNPITTNYGFTLTFEFVIWTNDRDVAADGIAVVLWDGAAAPMAGGWGGSLGYAQHTDFGSVGMNGGFTAFGFDTYGNFSNPTEDREGGPGFRPYSVVLRGSMGADRFQGYPYLTGAYAPWEFATLNARSSRPAANRRYFVILTMNTNSTIRIQMRRGTTGGYTTVVNNYQTPLVYPNQVMIGFTASTGGETSVQELRNFVVTPIDQPECWVDADCPPGYGCLGYVCETETLIELGSFDATWEDSGVAVNWATDTEIDNAYFNLYRAESIKTARTEKKNFLKKLGKWLKSKNASKKGPYVKINADPIAALGESPSGASYEFVDTDVQTGKRYWYVLEDVDLYGTATKHSPCGPVSAWEDCAYMP